MLRLEDKVAVISGGTSGIGLAIARRFAKEGAHVFIFGRRRDALDAAGQCIGDNFTAIQADASKLEDLDRVAGVVRGKQGRVDVVVSNAALVEQVPLRDITPNHSTYAAAKAALRSYSRTWAAEFKDSGIRANTLSPGVVDTPMLDSQARTPALAAEIRRGYAAYTPMLRLADPNELAAAALFLASDESSFMTGSDTVVDGGVSNV